MVQMISSFLLQIFQVKGQANAVYNNLFSLAGEFGAEVGSYQETIGSDCLALSRYPEDAARAHSLRLSDCRACAFPTRLNFKLALLSVINTFTCCGLKLTWRR